MIVISPSAVELLANLRTVGIDLEFHDGAIRFRPPDAMTPALVERLQAQKAELHRLLDTEAAVTEQRQSIERRWKDPAWRSAWERRFQAAQIADFASLRRVLDLILEQAEGHHRRQDWKRFALTCRYLHRLASGEEWDLAEKIDSRSVF
jgi:hypothetical protein